MTQSKKLLFYIGLFLIPFLLLAILEMGLRLLDTFPQEPLYTKEIVNGKNVFQLNSYVGKRYFPESSPALPTLYPETFSLKKDENTFRIFCLGGSTTAGFPFEYQVPFPKQLQFLLMDSNPKMTFEVINLGLSAINSFSVLDLIPEVLDAEPDAILIYMGHNEFYGVYGSASTFSVGSNGSWVRFYLWLEKFQITRMIGNLLASFSVEKTEKSNTGESLMSAVVEDRKITLNSEKYKQTLTNYQENLALILEKCKSKNVPVIIGDLISNEKDLAPFDSENNNSTSDETVKAIESILISLENDSKSGKFTNALESINDAISTDSNNAKLHFLKGQALLAINDTSEAQNAFQKAKDLDVIRFRASSDMNTIIRESANNFEISLANVEDEFRKQAIGEIIGEDLVCDHLHPNPNGYWLMAKAFYKALNQEFPKLTLKQTAINRPLPYFVTDLDWEIGLLKIHKMTRRWPFPTQPSDIDSYNAYSTETTKRIAKEYIFSHKNWLKAHQDLAKKYESENNLSNAIKEFTAISAYFPDNFQSVMSIARLYKLDGDFRRAAHFYKTATTIDPNQGMAHYQLAIVKNELNDLTGALLSMKNAVFAQNFSPENRLNAKYYLSGFLIETNQITKAKELLKSILETNPEYHPAAVLLQQISS